MATSGRPRQADISIRLVQSFAELVPQVGYSQLTVEQLVRHAGTSKPAFYRRFSDMSELVPLILQSQFGTDEDVDTGSIVTDLLVIQLRQCALFDHALTRSALAGYLDYISMRPDAAAPFVNGYIAPRRAYTSVLLARAVERGEIAPYDDPAYVADLLTGPVLMRGLMPGMPRIDGSLVAKTVATVLDSIGYAGDRSALDDVQFPPADSAG